MLYALFMGLSGGCLDNEGALLCTGDEECGGDNVCFIAPISRLQYCADRYPGCESGYRWASTAGDELAGMCVTDAPGSDSALVDASEPADAEEGDGR